MIFSIVIPTYNRNEQLCRCLHLLDPNFQSTTARYEVLVTDDSKGNEAKPLIDKVFPWVQWLEGPKKGPAANRNSGASYAKGEWLIFLDDDCLPSTNILNTYLEAKNKNDSVSVFEGCIKADRQQKSFIEESPINETGGFLWSCNFMINKDIFFNRLIGFDEKFPYAAMEDVDLYYRLAKLGIQSVFVKESFVIHPWRLQQKMYITTLKRFRSELYFLEKHPEMDKELNAKYYLRVFLVGIRTMIRKSFQYNFRGFRGQLINCSLYLYFCFYLLIRKIFNSTTTERNI